MQYKPVKSLPQYKSYESYLEKLLWIEKRSASEQDEVDQLITLIKKWDEVNGSTSHVLPPAPVNDPVKQMDVLMKEQKVNSSDLATVLGISQSAMSDILNYRKELSAELISKLSLRFKVPKDVFEKI